MFLRENKWVKDGKVHRYWSVVETVRSNSGVFQRQVLYLGEINDSQQPPPRLENLRQLKTTSQKG